jgi:hypothetical protein
MVTVLTGGHGAPAPACARQAAHRLQRDYHDPFFVIPLSSAARFMSQSLVASSTHCRPAFSDQKDENSCRLCRQNVPVVRSMRAGQK